jgi:DNA-directed RNA polymerase specialized sigma subunit
MNTPANQPKKSPSILGDVTPPFSGARPTGVAPEFDGAFAQWQSDKSPQTNTHLLSTLQPVIDTAVTSYGGASPSPTLKSRARLMALKAMSTYDPQRGNVRTHLLSQLQGLRRLSAQEQNIISIPEQVGLDFQKLHAAQQDLTDQLSREPTDDELADYTNLSPRRISKIRVFNQPLAEGTTNVESADGDNAGGSVASNLPGNHSHIDAWMNFVYDDLSPTDKLVMDMTLGRNGRRRASTQEIAKRLNITPGAVSQRAAKIQTMLDKRYTHNF